MAKRKFSDEQINRITGATRHEDVRVPFYYTPPFMDQLQEFIGSRLSSSGGRPTLRGAEVVRKVRFSKKHWQKLEKAAKQMSRAGTSVTPAQVAGSILDRVLETKR